MGDPSRPEEPSPATDASLLLREKRHLTGVAYRLLGSLADAEDVVQEAYARWYALSEAHRAEIDSPGAWLTTVASRICLDQLRSARVRRERYVGEWIPEPIPGGTEWFSGSGGLGETGADPADKVSLDESITMAFLVVLDSMSPAERVSFVLHDVFRYPFEEVASVVGRTPAACRQLASVARRRLRASRASTDPQAPPAELIREFKRAWESKDIAGLVGLLDPDASSLADSGGRATVVSHVLEGATAIARSFVQVIERTPGLQVAERVVNGQPGLAAQLDGVTVCVLAFDVADTRITKVWAVRNPDKLDPF